MIIFIQDTSIEIQNRFDLRDLVKIEVDMSSSTVDILK